jgi:hypothetical protein
MIVRILSVLLLCSVVAGSASPSQPLPAGSIDLFAQVDEAGCGDTMGSAGCALACAVSCACISAQALLVLQRLEPAVPLAHLQALVSIRARAPDTKPPKRSIA